MISIEGRVPPHNADAENAVLSAVLMDSAAIDEVAPILRPCDFYSSSHADVYAAVLALHAAGVAVDMVTVAAKLGPAKLQAVGGVAWIARVVDFTPAVHHVADHARLVRAKANIRRMAEVCQRLAAEAYGDVGDPEAWLQSAEQRVYECAHSEAESEMTQIADLVVAEIASYEADQARGGAIHGTETGFGDLDELLCGMHDGEAIIVAARPGMGKSSFALDVARHVAKGVDSKGRFQAVAIFSLEMPKSQVAAKLICGEGDIDAQDYRGRRLPEGPSDRMLVASNSVHKLPIFVSDKPGISLLELRAQVRRKSAEHRRNGGKLALVVVDYLQLMRGRDGCSSREQEISEISRGLKALAKEISCPIMVLSQLNRDVEARATKRPQLSDLRESGAIEQDADVVVFVHRPEYYLTPEQRLLGQNAALKGLAELIVSKQRAGPPGDVKAQFRAKSASFSPLGSTGAPEEREYWQP